MSLIPNESYSFPDHFLRAQSRARAQHQKNLAAPAKKTRESTPAQAVVRALAPVERPLAPVERPLAPVERPLVPVERPSAPIERAPAPIVRAPAPIVPAPATLPRSAAAAPVKVTPSVRPRGLTPRPTAPAKPARPAFVPRQPASQPKIPKSARQEAAPAVDEFQFDLFPEKTHRRNNRPHRGKLLRFFLFEGLAALVLAPCAVLIFLRYLTDPTLIMVTNIAAIASAIALAIIPIVFFAIGPTLPRGED
jgi:hypothetical protein